MTHDLWPLAAATYMPSDYDLSRREHRYDREVAAAVYHRFRAASGLGFKFEVPPSLRRAP